MEAINKFRALPIKMLTQFLIEIAKVHMEVQKSPQSQSSSELQEAPSQLSFIDYRVTKRHSMELAQTQTKAIDKEIQLHPPGLLQRC